MSPYIALEPRPLRNAVLDRVLANGWTPGAKSGYSNLTEHDRAWVKAGVENARIKQRHDA